MGDGMRGIGPYLLTRIALMIPMLWVLLTLVFTILHVLPGDPCVAMLGRPHPPGGEAPAPNPELEEE